MELNKILVIMTLAVTIGIVCVYCDDDDDDNLPSSVFRAAVIACTDFESGRLAILDLDEDELTNTGDTK